jgi:hypothetical protein
MRERSRSVFHGEPSASGMQIGVMSSIVSLRPSRFSMQEEAPADQLIIGVDRAGLHSAAFQTSSLTMNCSYVPSFRGVHTAIAAKGSTQQNPGRFLQALKSAHCTSDRL